MITHFTWKTKLFSRKFEIYLYENLSGELKKEGLSRKLYGVMGEKKILFETKGFFKPETQITDHSDGSLIGTISYNFWKSRSQISYNQKKYSWQFDNFWRTKWSLGNENGYLVRYHVKGLKGTIDSYTDDAVLVLTGFFIRNYYGQRHAQAAAAS